jgi:general secretion pathway protein B
MSYILEALKKAENERRQDGTQPLPPLHGLPTLSPAPRSLRFGRTLGLVMLLLTLLGGIYGYNSVPTGTVSSVPSTDVNPTSTRPVPTEPSTPPSADIGSTLDTGSEQLSRPLAIKNDRQKIRHQRQAGQPERQREETSHSPTKQDALPSLQEVPPAIRATLPDLKLAGHTYSEDPQRRMIIINGKILKEGDRIDADSRLAEITWEGIIVESQGVRFQAKNP